jgi:hypothetical protein
MPSQSHEVPTHLNVEDKVLFGLTVRQFLYLLVGSSASYTLWSQLAGLGDVLRMAGVTLCVGVTLALALLRPAGRLLEEWLAAALVFAITPRRATWRPAEPSLADWRVAGATWHELVPSPVWAEEDSP